MLESLANNTFTYKKLTEEEQHSRGILGRLVGVIADTENPTRNGRKYGRELWENVFNDPIMEEKIANRCCFGELGHPADREEVDPEKIAICLAEKPKVGEDGKLYGIFDILNTPNGKILKALCDYGTKIGVSSRGSGDVLPNDEVDSTTYNCEGWDAVVIPAVKAARPQYVTESLDTKQANLKKALNEAYQKANDEDKKVMKESLDNLGIKLDEAKSLFVPITNPDDIPWGEDEIEKPGNLLSEEDEEPEVENEIEEPAEEEKPEDSEQEEEKVEEPNEESEEEPEEEQEEDIAGTVKEVKDKFKGLDNKSKVEYDPIVIGDETIPVTGITVTPQEEDDKVIISINYDYSPEMDDNIETEDKNLPQVDEEPVNDANDSEKAENAKAEVIDDEADKVLEGLKEALRSKGELEEKVKSLLKDKAVSDAKVTSLNEEINRYKLAFERTSSVAAKVKDLEKENKSLVESLSKKTDEVKNLNEKLDKTVKLNESVDGNARKVKTLTENLNALQKELETAESNHTEQITQYRKKLSESVKIANVYKAQATAAMNHYIEQKAYMLGVRPTDITGRLNESYTMADIDKVCDELLDVNINMSRLPFKVSGVSTKVMNESKSNNIKTDPDYGYEIDDSLLEMAGLK